MSDNPHANGGLLLKDLRLPDFRDYAVDVPGSRARPIAEATRVLGQWLTEVMRPQPEQLPHLRTRRDRVQPPAGRSSTSTDKQWNAEFFGARGRRAPRARRPGRGDAVRAPVPGLAGGLPADRRHGLFNCYEAFIHIIDSMFNQHAKWLKVTNHIPWRRPIASLNYLLSSHVWRQDHNGFSHQDPGFIDHVVNKSAEVVRVYLPPDANTLLSTYDHCLRSRQYVNVVVAGKQPAPNFLTMERGDRALHPRARASGSGRAPRCSAPIPTSSSRRPVTCRRWRRSRPSTSCARDLPDLKVRFVNVVDLMRLQDDKEHPHGLSEPRVRHDLHRDKPIIFAYHGYPWLIHRLTYRRTGHDNLHVRGYKEEGTTTTPFDMVMLNDLDRYHLVIDVIDRVPSLRFQRAPRCARRWSTSGSPPASTPASTATTCPRCATGCGRPRKEAGLDAGRAAGDRHRWRQRVAASSVK